MIRILHFADLHMGVENYSRVDPDTGQSKCLLDFQAAFDQVVEYASENAVDLVIFSGDAYKHRDPSQTHQREFASRVGKLAAGGIPVFLLVGNHDLPNAIGRATAVDIFDTLSVRNVIVGNQPGVYPISTSNGLVQVVALPWLKRTDLLNREEARHSSIEEIRIALGQRLTRIIEGNTRELNPDLPAVLSAHFSMANAVPGSERGMVLGQDPVLPFSSVANTAFDYVALGHIHRHQVLSDHPPVVYSGSLQAIDFSDEEDTKGFYVVEIDPGKKKGKRVTFEFRPSKARRFLTIKTTVHGDDPDPTTTVLNDIARRQSDIPGGIVRIQIAIPEHVDGLLQEQRIYTALSEAQHVSIAKEIQRERRTRLSGWSAEEMTPAQALKVYLEMKNTSPERARKLLEYGERLIAETLAED